MGGLTVKHGVEIRATGSQDHSVSVDPLQPHLQCDVTQLK